MRFTSAALAWPNSTAGVRTSDCCRWRNVTRLAGYVAHAVKIPAIVDADKGLAKAKLSRKRLRVGEGRICRVSHRRPGISKRCGHLAGKTIVDLKMMIARIKSAVRTQRQRFSNHSPGRTRAGGSLTARSSGPGNISLRAPTRFSQKHCKARTSSRFCEEIKAPLMAI